MIGARYSLAVALLCLAGNGADAFMPAPVSNVGRVERLGVSPTQIAMAESDVSVDYDAAAKRAYELWCAEFGKEASEEKFATFKANYEAISVANVSAAKKARDAGEDRPKDLQLNEFGDMTEAEYMAMQSGATIEEEAAPQKGAMETVLEASAAQSNASNALAEAADALAEEEAVSFR